MAPGYQRFLRSFRYGATDPMIGVLTGDAGFGKTAGMRNAVADLPSPDYQVIYLCDTAVSPLDLYRTLALELGVRPSHRRAQLWADLKKTLVHMVDERHVAPVSSSTRPSTSRTSFSSTSRASSTSPSTAATSSPSGWWG